MTSVGVEVGRGKRAVVYAYGDDRVIKVANSDTAGDWITRESHYLSLVSQLGASVPDGGQLIDLADGAALVCARVDGPTVWQALVDDPTRTDELARAMVSAQRALFDTPTTYALPDQRDRLRTKVRQTGALFDLDVSNLISWIDRDRSPRGLCHGDLHPHNVIISSDAPVLVDWYDANVGSATAEVARTVVLLDDESGVIDDLRRSYLQAAVANGLVDDSLASWIFVQRIARLSEGLGVTRLPELRRELADFPFDSPSAPGAALRGASS